MYRQPEQPKARNHPTSHHEHHRFECSAVSVLHWMTWKAWNMTKVGPPLTACFFWVFSFVLHCIPAPLTRRLHIKLIQTYLLEDAVRWVRWFSHVQFQLSTVCDIRCLSYPCNMSCKCCTVGSSMRATWQVFEETRCKRQAGHSGRGANVCL